MERIDRRSEDLSCSRSAFLLWGIPWILMFIGAAWSSYLYWYWIPSLAIAGGACVYNVWQCGRVHCFVTGPVLLLAAGYLGFAAAQLLPLSLGWFAGVVLSICVVSHLAERWVGFYRSAGDSVRK